MSSTDFEWQTDEGETEAVVQPVAAPIVRRQWPWRLLLGVVVLATAVILGLRWRTARQTAAITADVQIAHALVQEAKNAQDTEMLNLVLSGRDLSWQKAQQELMSEGNFASRPAFGLQAVPAADFVPEIELSPDLKEVVVVSPQRFAVAGGEEVVLQETAVYRQGTRNWLLSPPEDAFWGQIVITHTRYFTVTYPQRDEIWVQRLTTDLNKLLDTRICDHILFCGTMPVDLGYNSTMPIGLRFSSSPQSLVAVTDPLGLLTMGEVISLPTPTLVGLPVDEAGYEALLRGYEAQVVTAFILYRFNYECCEKALITHALVTKQVSELSLQTWPLTSTDYTHILNFTFDTKTVLDILVAEDISRTEDRQLAYALVDFLLTEVAWQPTRLLVAAREDATLLEGVQRQDFAERWLAFVYEQTANGRTPPATTPPAISASCPGPQGASLYTYEPASGSWSVTAPERPLFAAQTFLWPLPEGEGYLVNQRMYTRFESETRLMLNYQEEDFMLRQYILTELYPLPQYEFTRLRDPSGRYLVFYESGRTRFDGNYFIIDLTSCANERCQMQTVLGEPHWSPDGSQIVMAERPIRNRDNDPYEPFQLPLSWSDSVGESVTALGTGYAPAWVDNEHYGYLRLNEERVSEWVVAAVADARVQVELEAEDLLTAVSANSRPEQLFMRDTIIANPDRIAIIAATELLTDSLDYVFLWHRASEPQLMQIGEGLQVAFSPDGRYLTITGLDGIVTLINLSTGDQQQFLSPQVSPDWTADSQWLLTGRDNYLLLTAVNDDYQQIVLRDLSGCKQISWSQ